jgi:hypothetical protein
MSIQRSAPSSDDRVVVEHTAREGGARDQGRRRTAVLLGMGCLSLAAGVLVYLTDRSASHLLGVPAVPALAERHLFGAVGQWLPSFAHTLAFSLFCAALLAPRPRWEYGACAFWLGVNAAFEVGQHPQVRGPLVDALRHDVGRGPIGRVIENYFLYGTFDVADLVASALGAALAATLLHRVRVRAENRHAASNHLQ